MKFSKRQIEPILALVPVGQYGLATRDKGKKGFEENALRSKGT